MTVYKARIRMEESVEGVDWHRNGADCPWWLVAIIIAAMAIPVMAAGAMIVIGWLA